MVSALKNDGPKVDFEYYEKCELEEPSTVLERIRNNSMYKMLL